MIAQLTGTVVALGPTSVVVDVSGVGLEANCTPQTVATLRLGELTTLATALVVREDSLTLYGFASVDEREMFALLQTATGVGPRLAQAYLSVLTPDDIRRAIGDEDLAALTRVPGVGKKGAQRLVVELKDRMNALGPVQLSTAPSVGLTGWREQVTVGLQGLGWTAREAEAAAAGVVGLVEQNPNISIAELMRAALRNLAR